MSNPAVEATLAGRRVLVVEDEFFLADDLAQALEKLGAEVVGPVPSKDKALTLLEAGPLDAAVLDINLKGEAVFPVADALRQQGVPFVFATGYDEASVPSSYQDVPRWEKPFKPGDLAKMLPGLLERP